MAVQFGIGHYRPLRPDWVTVKRFADVTVTDLVSVALLVTMGSRAHRNTSF